MSRTILLADDSITIHKVVELTFQDSDCTVASFDNGDEALEQAEALAPDLVIADIHMPGADGYEVARRVKEDAPQTPVLLLVGTFEPFDESEVADSGADGFLMKPFDSQELLARVDELLGAAPEEKVAEPAPVEPAMKEAEKPAAEPESVAAAPTEAPSESSSTEVVESPDQGEGAGLSEAEIDRIARRVVAAITPEIVREVAREVVPQVAEIVVRERIRQLEQDVE